MFPKYFTGKTEYIGERLGIIDANTEDLNILSDPLNGCTCAGCFSFGTSEIASHSSFSTNFYKERKAMMNSVVRASLKFQFLVLTIAITLLAFGVHSFPTRRSSDLDRKSVV